MLSNRFFVLASLVALTGCEAKISTRVVTRDYCFAAHQASQSLDQKLKRLGTELLDAATANSDAQRALECGDFDRLSAEAYGFAFGFQVGSEGLRHTLSEAEPLPEIHLPKFLDAAQKCRTSDRTAAANALAQEVAAVKRSFEAVQKACSDRGFDSPAH